MTEDEARTEYIELLPELREFRASLVAELGRVIGANDAELNSRIKSWESLRDKVSRLNVSRIADIQDLVGIRVVVPNVEALFHAADAVTREFFVTSHMTQHLRENESATYLVARSRASLSGGVAAEIQILTAAEDARRTLEHELRYRIARGGSEAGHSVKLATRSLSDVLNEFETLIERPGVHEKHDVHPFLENHSFILFQSPDAVTSEVPIGLGTEYQIDFLIRKPDGLYILVEIENPRTQIITKSGDFTASVNHALCQVEDWQEWIEANLQTVERYYPGIRAPEAWVVIGRDRELTESANRRVARRNVNMRGRVVIKTYDDLLRDGRAYVRSIGHALDSA